MLSLLLACVGPDNPRDRAADSLDSATQDSLDSTARDSLDSDPCEPQHWYIDEDGDGYGAESIEDCEQPSGTVEQGGDCDDTDPSIHPGAEAVHCNRVDESCEGAERWVPERWDTLEDAVVASPSGAHICLDEGTFVAQQISLWEHSVHVHGRGPGTIVDLDGGHFLFSATHSDLSLEDLTVQGLVISGDNSGLLRAGGGSAALRRVTLKGLSAETGWEYVGNGLVYANSADVTIEDVTVLDMAIEVWHEDESKSTGLLVDHKYGGSLNIDGLRVEGGSIEVWSLDCPVHTFYPDAVSAGRIELSGLHIQANRLYGLGLCVDTSASPATIEDLVMERLVFEYGGLDVGAFALELIYTSAEIQRLKVVSNQFSAELMEMGSLVVVTESDLTMENVLYAANTFEGEHSYSRAGPMVSGSGSVSLRNADIADNLFVGLPVSTLGFEIDGSVEVVNTSIVGNSSDHSISTALYSGEEGAAMSATYTNVHDNNAEALTQGVSEPTGLLDVDPGYAGVLDYRLAANSPLIDAGDPDLLDADGSRSDIGAYGGPAAD